MLGLPTHAYATRVVGRLARDFYSRPTLLVARDLLGTIVVHNAHGIRRAGRIVETEAYVGPTDAASHARSGPSGRAAVMWQMAGLAYVYLIYGLHHCFNVVTEPEGTAGAVLIRAIEPLDNAERANGPALVCKSLQIDRSMTGLDLVTSPELFLESGAVADADVRVGPRIGVDYAGEWANRPFRFWLADSPHVSRRRITGTTFNSTMLG
jgi:DNA-3-methyladenine glycosylase